MQGEGHEREARPWLVQFLRFAGDDGGKCEEGLRLVEMPRRRSGCRGLTKLTGGRRGVHQTNGVPGCCLWSHSRAVEEGSSGLWRSGCSCLGKEETMGRSARNGSMAVTWAKEGEGTGVFQPRCLGLVEEGCSAVGAAVDYLNGGRRTRWRMEWSWRPAAREVR